MNEAITKASYPTINAFDFSIKYTETDRASHFFEIDLHTHRECEIYINLSGDVSFMVEKRLYPLCRGDVIIARPGEYHHCVYHSDAKHALYWILFDANGNEALFPRFFKRRHGEENLISPTEESKARLLQLCEKLLQKPLNPIGRYAAFFELLEILESAKPEHRQTKTALPPDIASVLEYIDAHLSESLTRRTLSQIAYTSQSTLERRFSEILGMHISTFIRKRRLSKAALLLQQGRSVMEAGLAVGYTDNSHFIKLFRENCGITPFQYKKKYGDA